MVDFEKFNKNLKTLEAYEKYYDNIRKVKSLLTIENCSTMEDVINHSYSWSNTPEGHDFWAEIHYEIGELE